MMQIPRRDRVRQAGAWAHFWGWKLGFLGVACKMVATAGRGLYKAVFLYSDRACARLYTGICAHVHHI